MAHDASPTSLPHGCVAEHSVANQAAILQRSQQLSNSLKKFDMQRLLKQDLYAS